MTSDRFTRLSEENLFRFTDRCNAYLVMIGATGLIDIDAAVRTSP
jgi:hypothetical protein